MGLNVYVDDELYVAEVTPEARRYSRFQHIELHTVGDLACGSTGRRPSSSASATRAKLDVLGARMRARFGGRLWIAKSLPYFLEFANAGVSKASALEFLAGRLGFARERTVTLGDGENDLDLVAWGYGIAVENADPRVKELARWVCPPAAEEGAAAVIEALVSSKA